MAFNFLLTVVVHFFFFAMPAKRGPKKSGRMKKVLFTPRPSEPPIIIDMENPPAINPLNNVPNVEQSDYNAKEFEEFFMFSSCSTTPSTTDDEEPKKEEKDKKD